MNSNYFVLILLLFCVSSCAQRFSDEVTGCWRYVGLSKSNLNAVECPDVLYIKKDGSYAILNDCYGADPKLPVVEEGLWFFEPSEQKVMLNSRKFSTNYLFQNEHSTLSFFVLELNKETMRISFSRDLSEVEVYKKLSDCN